MPDAVSRALGALGRLDILPPEYVFFASEAASSYTTGEALTLLGGETAAT